MRHKRDYTGHVNVPMSKQSPHDTDIEEAVLGAMMIDKNVYGIVRNTLTPDCFYNSENEKIFRAVSELGALQRPIDVLTVVEQLRINGDLEYVGGPTKIANLASKVYSADNVEYHAQILVQKFIARRLIEYAAIIEAKAFDEANDIDDVMQEAESMLFDICQNPIRRKIPFVDTYKQDTKKKNLVDLDLVQLRRDLEKCSELPQNWSVWAHNNGYNDEVAELIKTILAVQKVVRSAAAKNNMQKLAIAMEQRYGMEDITIGSMKQIEYARSLRYNMLTWLERQLKKLKDDFPDEASRADFLFAAARQFDSYNTAKDVIEVFSKVKDPYEYFKQYIR